MVRRIGRTRYLVILLSVTSVLVLAFGCQFTIWSTLVTTFSIGFAYQSSKVCMDSVVQADSDDAHVGRVFALYDTANTLCYVGAFAIGVAIVPEDGAGVGAVVLVSVLFLVCGLGYGLAVSRLRRGPVELNRLDLLVNPDDPIGGEPAADPAGGTGAAAEQQSEPVEQQSGQRPG